MQMSNTDPCAIAAKLQEFIQTHLGIPPDSIKSDTVLLDGVDSLGRMNLMLAVEDEYDLDLEEIELNPLTTYSQLETLIIAKVGARNA